MVKNNKNENKNKNEKYVGLGTSLGNSFVLCGFVTSNKHETACCCLLVVAAFLYDDDNKVSHPLVRSLVRSGSRFINA